MQRESWISEALGAALQQPCYGRGAVLDGLTSRHVAAGPAARAVLAAWGLRDTSSPSPAPVPAAAPAPAASKAPAGKGSKPASPVKAGHASPGAAAEAAAAAAHASDHMESAGRASSRVSSRASNHVPVWGGQQRVYLVELTGALEQPDAPAALAALPPSGGSAAQAGAGSAPAPSKPAVAPDALLPTPSDAGPAELAGIAAGAGDPKSALTVRRVPVGQGAGSSPEAVHRAVCGLAWELGQLRCALPRVDADAALIPEPYTMQARRSS